MEVERQLFCTVCMVTVCMVNNLWITSRGIRALGHIYLIENRSFSSQKPPKRYRKYLVRLIGFEQVLGLVSIDKIPFSPTKT